MTGKQVYSQLTNFGDLDITEIQAVGWIDMCQKEVALEIPVVYTETVNDVVNGTELVASNGVINLISATDSSGNEYPLKQIEVRENKLVFHQATDSVTVKYSGSVPDYVSLLDELTIHPLFHSHMVFFLISMFYDSDGEGDSEESSLAERFYQRWLYYKAIAISTIQSSDYKTSANTPVDTSDVLPRSRRHSWGGDFYE